MPVVRRTFRKEKKMKAKTLYKDFLESTPKEKQDLLRLVSKWAVQEDDPNDERYVYNICYGMLINYLSERIEDTMLFIFMNKWEKLENKMYQIETEGEEFEEAWDSIKKTKWFKNLYEEYIDDVVCKFQDEIWNQVETCMNKVEDYFFDEVTYGSKTWSEICELAKREIDKEEIRKVKFVKQ